MKKRLYFTINLLAVLLSAALFAQRIFVQPSGYGLPAPSLWYAAVFAGVLVIALLKLGRFYLVLLEEGIPAGRFVQVYAKTTFVNLLLPFKTGELFRIYCFAHETHSFYTGFFSAIVDRFFDTCALLAMFVPYELLVCGRLSFVSILLLLFLAVLWGAYLVFPTTYTYLNRYAVLRVQSKRAVSMLKALDTLHECHSFVRGMVRGRAPLLLAISLVAWCCEGVTAYSLARLLQMPATALLYEEYILAVYQGVASPLVSLYAICMAMWLAGLLAVTYIGKFTRKERACGKEHHRL